MLRSVQLPFARPSIIQLHPLTMFVGPNGCGKTHALVHAIAASQSVEWAVEPLAPSWEALRQVMRQPRPSGRMERLWEELHTRNGIVVIDDMEQGLHIGAQYRFMKAVIEIVAKRPGLQVICSTHSPYLLDELPPKFLYVMCRGEDGYTRIKPLTDAPGFERWSRALRTGELWASIGEDWVLVDSEGFD